MINSIQFETEPGKASTPAAAETSTGSATPGDGMAGTLTLEDTFVFPASREQTRYWMLAQLDPESTASNMAIAFEIEGALSCPLVEQAIAALTMRHEALRTVFRLEGGLLSQVVLSRPLYCFTTVDLRAVDGAEQAEALEAAVSRHGHTLIDLENGPVLHALLIELSESRNVLALTMNHIVCDGWSNGILIRDFTLIYEALRAGCEPLLPELPFQFADFSLWQNEYLASPAASEAAAFWKTHVTSDLLALDLPTDHPRPSGRSFPGHIESALLPKAIDDELKAYCRSTGSTKHIVLLAAFEALCAMYTGQKQFLLGSTIANRTQPGMEDVVGRFANPQIIVARVEGDPAFTQLEQRVREWETAAYTHQDLPFSRVIEDFQIDQAGATSQFLQVWFLYQKAFMQPQAGQSIRVTPRRSVSGGVDFDLLVSVVERAEGPRIQFEYNTLIFEPARIRGLIASFIQLLGGALQQPALALSKITGPAAPARLYGESAALRQPPEPAPVYVGLLALLAKHAEARPGAVAVSDGRISCTWGELDARSSALAQALEVEHPAPSTFAIVLAPRIESFVALLAALKLGARIVPLPGQTDGHGAAACAAASGAFLLAPGPSLEGQGLAFEEFTGTLASRPAWHARNLDGGESTFLLLTDASAYQFVERSSEMMLRSVMEALGHLVPGEDTSLLSFAASTPLDACLDLLTALASGAQLNHAVSFDGLAGQLAGHEASWILAAPSHVKQMLAGGWAGDRRVSLILRGERLPAKLGPLLTIRLKLAAYLLSTPEAGGYAAIQYLGGEKAALGVCPLGSGPLTLINTEGAPVPFGAFGEICLRDGRCTGMMAQSTSTGIIELLDRAPRFVELRGHRVCLGDIEDAAFSFPPVHAAAVALTGQEAETRLLLCLAAPPQTRDDGALRRHLAHTLPSHMVPSDLVWLAALPLLADGSLDLRRLPERDSAPAAAASDTAVMPLNDVEEKLAGIWKDVLGTKSIDIQKSFFELGGSSLLLVRLFARVNKGFGTSLPITTIFDAQSVAALAAVLGGGTTMSHLVQVQTAGSKPPLFMIHSYLLYQGMSMTLGTDQPFYGLRELEQDGKLNIEERVKRYVAEIRQVQPHGPYHLAGWCAAGPLTIEVARQLLLCGQHVRYLALFDSWLPGYLESIEAKHKSDSWLPYKTVGSKVAYHGNKLRPLNWTKKAMYAWMILGRLAKETRYRFYLNNWERVHRLSVKYNFSLPQFMHNTSFQTFSALKEYHGQRVPLRLTLIRASDSREVAGAAASCGWEQVAEQGVDVVWAPGDHETMFIGDHLKATSDIVRRGLEASSLSGKQVAAMNADGSNAGQIRGMMHVDCPST